MRCDVSRVLIMEDDALIRGTMVRALEHQGHEVDDFADAAPALQEADLAQVDLVLTDLRMPTRGSEAIRTLRARGVTCPIIVVSGYASPKDAAHLKALGADFILPKPFGLQELLATAKDALAQPYQGPSPTSN